MPSARSDEHVLFPALPNKWVIGTLPLDAVPPVPPLLRPYKNFPRDFATPWDEYTNAYPI